MKATERPVLKQYKLSVVFQFEGKNYVEFVDEWNVFNKPILLDEAYVFEKVCRWVFTNVLFFRRSLDFEDKIDLINWEVLST